jgi:hypothetical protein
MSPVKMGREALRRALATLGRRAREPVSLVLGGSAALILSEELRRPTDDGDVVTSEPDIGSLQELIRIVADREGLPAEWLNGSIQSYTHVLPKDYKSRLVSLPPFGHLRVRLLGRPDVILMKVYGMRARDVEDLRAIRPTTEELAFVRAQLPRILAKEPEKAREMDAFLDEWVS